jgi:CRP-like cAMP-binding protein
MNKSVVPANDLLAALPPDDWQRMKSDFTEIILEHHDLLHDLGDPLQRIHFPTDGVVSTVATFEDGTMAEAATTGLEGVVEIGAILGGQTALGRTIVQVPGAALATSFEAFKNWQRESTALQQILLTYSQAFITQTLQCVACNAVHSTEQRAARWLLACDDRTRGNSFLLTQDFIAEMLGVGRPTVSAIARTFQAAGLMRYRRGIISIANRSALESVSCECYRVIRSAFQKQVRT